MDPILPSGAGISSLFSALLKLWKSGFGLSITCDCTRVRRVVFLCILPSVLSTTPTPACPVLEPSLSCSRAPCPPSEGPLCVGNIKTAALDLWADARERKQTVAFSRVLRSDRSGACYVPGARCSLGGWARVGLAAHRGRQRPGLFLFPPCHPGLRKGCGCCRDHLQHGNIWPERRDTSFVMRKLGLPHKSPR